LIRNYLISVGVRVSVLLIYLSKMCTDRLVLSCKWVQPSLRRWNFPPPAKSIFGASGVAAPSLASNDQIVAYLIANKSLSIIQIALVTRQPIPRQLIVFCSDRAPVQSLPCFVSADLIRRDLKLAHQRQNGKFRPILFLFGKSQK
jgi:hypothetical protein